MEKRILMLITSIANLKGFKDFEILDIIRTSIKESLKDISDVVVNLKENKIEIKKSDDLFYDFESQNFSRTDIQKIKNCIFYKINLLENEKFYLTFKDKINTIEKGQIRGMGHNKFFIDINGVEAELDKKNIIPGEKFFKNFYYKFLIKEVLNKKTSILIKLNRSSADFVIALLKEEIPEIKNEMIIIDKIARIPGYKTLIILKTKDGIYSKELIGACIGPKGTRIRSINAELKGERIEFLNFDENVLSFIRRSYGDDSIISFEETDDNINIKVNKRVIPKVIGKSAYNVKLLQEIFKKKIFIKSNEEKSNEEKSNEEKSNEEKSNEEKNIEDIN